MKPSEAAAVTTFGEIEIGQAFSVERTFTTEDVAGFAAISGDHSPLHVDPDYAAQTEFGRNVVHGMLLASLFSQLVGMRIPGKHALYLGQDLTFRRPILVGEPITALARVSGRNEATRTISLITEVRGADGKVAVAGTAKVKVRDNGASATRATAADLAPAARAKPDAAAPVAFVAGGSRGIGAQIARHLAGAGFAVAVNYLRSKSRAEALVAELNAAGASAIAVQGDVREAGDVSAALHTVSQALGPVSILVNVATGELQQGPFGEFEWDAFQADLDYQVKAVMHLCRGVHAAMKASGGGAIVNVLSQVVNGAPPPKMAPYVTAKYALMGLSKALAAEWAGDGIRVNMVSPGMVQTELTEHYHERVFKMEAARTPLGRLATPNDVAAAVLFLASEEARFLTGVNLSVTGGQVMS